MEAVVGVASVVVVLLLVATGLGSWRRGDRSVSWCVLCALVFPATWTAWTWLDLYAGAGARDRPGPTPWWNRRRR